MWALKVIKITFLYISYFKLILRKKKKIEYSFYVQFFFFMNYSNCYLLLKKNWLYINILIFIGHTIKNEKINSKRDKSILCRRNPYHGFSLVILTKNKNMKLIRIHSSYARHIFYYYMVSLLVKNIDVDIDGNFSHFYKGVCKTLGTAYYF